MMRVGASVPAIEMAGYPYLTPSGVAGTAHLCALVPHRGMIMVASRFNGWIETV